jgi:tetratricopeptide (TPR) repeat protein
MKEAFREAADLAESAGLAEHLAQAAVGYGGRFVWEVSRGDDYLPRVLQRALAALPDEDSKLRVRLLSRLAGGPMRDASFSRTERHELGSQALAMARRLDDPSTLAYAIDGYIVSHHAPDHTPEQLKLAKEMVEVSLAVGDKERAIEAYEQLFDSLVELGDLDEARKTVDAMGELAGELRQPAQDWSVAVHRALLVLQDGRLDEAEELIAEARRCGEHAQSWNATVSYQLQMYVLRWHQGRLAEMEPVVRRAVEEHPTYLVWRCVLAHLEAQLGGADAGEAFEALAANDFAELPFDEEWLVSIGLLADAARIRGDAERSALLYEQLLPYADRISVSYPEIGLGSASRYLGILAATTSRWDDAKRHFETALDVNARIGAQAWLAATHHDYGAMLLGLDEPDAGREQLERAVEGYTQLGMDRWAGVAAAVKAPSIGTPASARAPG